MPLDAFGRGDRCDSDSRRRLIEQFLVTLEQGQPTLGPFELRKQNWKVKPLHF
jgi:hypothetical protein